METQEGDDPRLIDLFFRMRHCDWIVLMRTDGRSGMAMCKACGNTQRVKAAPPATCAVDDLLNRRAPA